MDEKSSAPRGWYSRGYLPHFDGGEIAQFVTYRLADSIPRTVLERWHEGLERKATPNADAILRRRIEQYLDQGYGSCHLRDECLAAMVQSAMLHFDAERYKLAAWVVMPNHVHILLTPQPGHKLPEILHTLKSYTAHEANRLRGVKGRFWQVESFDRFIRDHKHYTSVLRYIENNPVKSGLCSKPEDWPYSSAHFRRQD